MRHMVDSIWPEIEWTDSVTDARSLLETLPHATAQRVRAHAEARSASVRDTIATLVLDSLEQLGEHQRGGRKRWAGVTASDRRVLAQRAAQARWGKKGQGK